ncbi:MAG: hypothetical protein RL199_1048 [Pseudomonadota bacterium]|jgi:hypothetical protein
MPTPNILQSLIAGGEAQVARLAAELVGNEKLLSTLQAVVSRALALKGAVDAQVATTLDVLHAPTSRDMRKLQDRLDELERLFEGLTAKADAIAGKFDAPPQS